MEGEAVKELALRFRGPAEVNGFLFRPNDWTVADPQELVKPGPVAKILDVATLGALRDYLIANRDELTLCKLVVHVADPSKVWVGSQLRARAREREYYIQAKTLDLTDGFIGKYMTLEDFIVGMQIRFEDVDDRARLLGLLSNVKHSTVKTALDDGVTQVVEARSGVALVHDVAVPNPVKLSPYRTFREVVQPSSLFVLRVQQGPQGGLPTVGLFEADGGAWKLTAVDRVRIWLKDELPVGIAVLA